jgi:hypothetical protein
MATQLETTAARPARYSAIRYNAYRIVDGRTYPLDMAPVTSLDEALTAAKLRCFHKDHLLIKATDEDTAETRLHIYAIKKKSQPTYVYRDFAYHREHTLYSEPVCVVGPEVL